MRSTRGSGSSLTWVGPRPETIAAMGDKLEAKQRMADAGVPVLPSAELRHDHDDDQLRDAAGYVGYPLMVKAAAGGGGKGMRAVHDPDDLLAAVAAARREAGSAFGDDRVFLERLVARPRHLEVQVLGDTHGQVVHLFERECSIQRRHQKVVEESPAPGITPAIREALTTAATDAARALGYVSAGTVEFVGDEDVLARLRAGEDLDPRDAFAFLEVNTRLQVEHPVTEEVVRVLDHVTGQLRELDLVRLQLLIAAGAPLLVAQDDVRQDGHAIEARLYAEDPSVGYLPATGTLHAFRPAGGAGVRWDVGVEAGDEVTPHYDPMLAKVVARAPTRVEAAARLATALDTTSLLGVTTNHDLLVAVLRDDAFLAGDTTTAFLAERFGDTPSSPAPRPADVDRAAVVAALHATAWTHAETAVIPSLPAGFASHATLPVQLHYVADDAERTVRLLARRDGSMSVEVRVGVPAGFLTDEGEVTNELLATVRAVGPDHLDVELDGLLLHARLDRAPDGVVEVQTGGRRVRLQGQPRFPSTQARAEQGAVAAPMPGTVVGVDVEVGASVTAGQVLVRVEAMKMEHRVVATEDGEVTAVHVEVGAAVAASEALVTIEPRP
jgi:propionyl-CoA carboxylase alpha chain